MIMTFIAGDDKSVYILAALIMLIMWSGKALWFSQNHGKITIALACLGVAVTSVALFSGWVALLEEIISTTLPKSSSNKIHENKNLAQATAFIFVSYVIYLVTGMFKSDRTGMGIHPDSIDKDIPEPAYDELREAVCNALSDELRGIDQKTNWSTHLFTPLDAEVERNTRGGRNRKITDLLKAIKGSKNRLFLVLGSPGAGKSVALRKLCQDLASESGKTGKIPIYVNLREWQVQERWSAEKPPTVNNLYDFVKNNVINRDIVTTRFFNKYFDRLYETGRLYFVLDSFDEIPAVLGENENSELIRILSKVIYKFLKGARLESQGILASRLFRKPTMEFQTDVTLEIRPFSEDKVIQTFRKMGNINEGIITRMFLERTDLVSIATNPFSSVLIAEYIGRNNGDLPPSQSEMYASYIDQTLHSCSDKIQKSGLNKNQVLSGTIEISKRMYDEYGLEAPITSLAKELPHIQVEKILEIITFSRLGRVGAGNGDNNVFSFSHRRFTEYFAIKHIINCDSDINLEVIPEDSQWRDALVLYCEVADREKAGIVANFCWETIREVNNIRDIRVIHSLRFLRDAFQNRHECLTDFNIDLSNFLSKQIHGTNDVHTICLCISALSLLNSNSIEDKIVNAIELNNTIVDESAINIYRNLSNVSKTLLKKISKKFIVMNPLLLIRNRKSLQFSFSLSPAFKWVSYIIDLRIFLFVTTILLSIVFYSLNPIYLYISLVTVALVFAIQVFISRVSKGVNGYDLAFIIIMCFCFMIPYTTFLTKSSYVDSVNGYLFENKSNYCNNNTCYTSSDIFPESTPKFLFLDEKMYKYKSDSRFINQFERNKKKGTPKLSFTAELSNKFSQIDKAVAVLLTIFILIQFLASIFSSLKTFSILNISLTVSILVFVIIFYEVFIHKYKPIFLVAILSIFVTLFLFKVLRVFGYIWKSYKDLRSLRLEDLNRKENVHRLLSNRDLATLTKKRIIQYLEKNNKPTGEWPDLTIFSVMKNGSLDIRLQRLEEKWRGLD